MGSVTQAAISAVADTAVSGLTPAWSPSLSLSSTDTVVTKRSDPSEPPSPSFGEPIDAFVRLIRGRHKADIVILLGKKDRRYSELRRSIPNISERALARQLDALERDGVVQRTAFAEMPLRVEYSLTPYGRTLCPILKSIWKWGVHSERS